MNFTQIRCPFSNVCVSLNLNYTLRLEHEANPYSSLLIELIFLCLYFTSLFLVCNHKKHI